MKPYGLVTFFLKLGTSYRHFEFCVVSADESEVKVYKCLPDVPVKVRTKMRHTTPQVNRTTYRTLEHEYAEHVSSVWWELEDGSFVEATLR